MLLSSLYSFRESIPEHLPELYQVQPAVAKAYETIKLSEDHFGRTVRCDWEYGLRSEVVNHPDIPNLWSYNVNSDS